MKHSLKLCDLVWIVAPRPLAGVVFSTWSRPAGLDSYLVVVKANGQEDPDGKRIMGWRFEIGILAWRLELKLGWPPARPSP